MHIYHNREKVFLCAERHTGGVPSRPVLVPFILRATNLDQHSNPGEKVTFEIFPKHFLAFSESLHHGDKSPLVSSVIYVCVYVRVYIDVCVCMYMYVYIFIVNVYIFMYMYIYI